ncbi:MAG: hypothetical protein ACQESR_14630 [Planctomycetota bacterium]
MQQRFDVLAASHGAASVGLIALFAVFGSLVLAEPTELKDAIGYGLLVVAVIYLVAMMIIGRLACAGGMLQLRFDFRAASHGAAGFCIVGLFACSGILTLQNVWRSPAAMGISLIMVSIGCAVGMVLFGLIGCSSPGGSGQKLYDEHR